jgi:tRNA(Arg) A34 adenosine deaminase TadA
MIDDVDRAHLRTTIGIAMQAIAHGNQPFGALLVDGGGRVVLQAENSEVTGADPTAHAETNLVRLAGKQLSPQQCASATLYASCEPCPMCAGAIAAAGIRRVVYALGQSSARRLMGLPPNPQLLGCAELLQRSLPPIMADGPALEDEAAVSLRAYWQL